MPSATDNNKRITTTNPAGNKSAESKKKKKKNKNNNNNINRILHLGLQKDGVLKGVVISISSGMSAQMTTEYRLYTTALISYAASKGYNRWHGVIKNDKIPDDLVWKIT